MLFKNEIIRKIHEKGHFASRKMESILSQNYYIPKMKTKIASCITNCIYCILASRKGQKEGFLHPIPKESVPLETYHMDHLGPLTPTKKGYRYLLTVVDAFTKFIWIYPLKTTSASESLKKIELQQSTFGNPRRIITDKGPAFTSSAFQEYCNNEDIEHITITTGIPRGNGQVERIHSIVISILTKLSIECEESWYKYANRVQRWINSSLQRSIGTSPFELMFGTKMRCPEDVKLADMIYEEVLQQFEHERNTLREQAARNIGKVQEENRRCYNRRRIAPTRYEVGDLVAIKRTQFGACQKISSKYLGPYRVTKVNKNERYDVKKVGSHEGPNLTSTAADHMKRFVYFDSDEDSDEDVDEKADTQSQAAQ